VTELPEVRDTGLLKIFLGADPKAVAAAWDRVGDGTARYRVVIDTAPLEA
jgi:hypothetical protein